MSLRIGRVREGKAEEEGQSGQNPSVSATRYRPVLYGRRPSTAVTAATAATAALGGEPATVNMTCSSQLLLAQPLTHSLSCSLPEPAVSPAGRLSQVAALGSQLGGYTSKTHTRTWQILNSDSTV